MNLFRRTPNSAIGISVDGLTVKAAHLRREGDQVVLVDVKTSRLKTRFDVEGEAEGEAVEPAEEDVLGLAPVLDVQEPAAEPEMLEGGEGGEETNTSALYDLLTGFPVGESTVAICLTETSLALHELHGLEELKGKQLWKSVMDQVSAAKGGISPTEDQIDFIRTGTGAVALVHEDRMELLALLDDLRPFFGTVRVGLIDANEISLMNLVRRTAPNDTQVTAIVYIGEEFSRAIFMRGSDYLGLTQVINEGVNSSQVLNTLFSRILFEQDTSHLPEIDRILLAGGGGAVDAKPFFEGQFPDAEVDYLIPSGVDLNLLDDQKREQVSEYDIPIGLAWKVLDPKTDRFYGTNFLPKERRRLQNPFEIAWHGLVLISLIAGTVLYFGLRLLEQDRSVDALRHRISMKEQQIQENSRFVSLVDSLQDQVFRYKQNLSVTDSLSSRFRAWAPLLNDLNEQTRDINSFWITGLSEGKESLTIIGQSIYRDRIPAVAGMIEGAEVRTITRSQIRNKGLYEFEMEVKSFKPLSDVEGVPAVSTVDTIDAGEEGDGPATIDPEPKGGFSGIQNLGENRDGKSVMVHSEIVPDSNPTDLHENGQEDRYVVHVGIFSDVKAADRRAVRLFQKGYPASVSIGEPTPVGWASD